MQTTGADLLADRGIGLGRLQRVQVVGGKFQRAQFGGFAVRQKGVEHQPCG